MSFSRRVHLSASHLAIAAITAMTGVSAALAGPLDPPAGPIAPTGRTLTQIEPRTPISLATTPGDADSTFKITQPGSYYLTGNVTGETGKHGIEIVSHGVTIDLNGFELVGVPGSLDGVAMALDAGTNTTIHNGSVRNWGGSGVTLRAAFTPGEAGIIRNVASSNNGMFGIRVGFGALVDTCTSTGNGSGGIIGYDTNTFINCTSSNNLYGMSAGGGSAFIRCTVANNAHRGISLSTNCTVTDCSVSYSGGDGIASLASSTISGCTVSSSGLAGIKVANACIVLDNYCVTNGGHGIEATGFGNRIERNTCGNNNGHGVFVSGEHNLIFRNICSANGSNNWNIAANNVYGPILNRALPLSPAVSGNAAPDTTATTSPNANFTY